MNWILLEQEEKLSEPNIYKLSVSKSNHIRSILKRIEPGERFRALIPGKSNGRIEIQNWIGEEVVVTYSPLEEIQVNSSIPYSLVSPLPRPQTGKKLLHLAGAYGLSQVIFYAHSSNNKQYLTSPVYNGDGFKEFYRSGLEQTGRNSDFQFRITTKSPFREQDTLSILGESNIQLVFHPYNSKPIREHIHTIRESIQNGKYRNVFIHLGSESGWTDEEIESFRNEESCKIYSLQAPVLRSEYALNSILQELEYIRSGH